jgi:thiamine thiazole synthase
MLDEKIISQAILEKYFEKLHSCLENDVSIVGGGPAGLICAYFLSKEGYKTCLFEEKLSMGGGMWGGGMLFNKIVVQEQGKTILDEFDINYEKYVKGYYVSDAIEAITTIASKTVKSGTQIFNCVGAEDVVLKKTNSDYHVCGLVVNWSPVNMAHLLVDPLVVESKYVVDATGHEAVVASTLEKKAGVKLISPTGKVIGEKPLWAEMGERDVVLHTKEVYPGLFVAGMSAVNVCGAHRMGPVFGGMMLSGKKAAQLIIEKLKKEI